MKIDPKTRDILFAVIRAGMGLDVPALKLSEEECTSLLRIARRQSILSIAYRGLRQKGVSQSVLKDYDQFRLMMKPCLNYCFQTADYCNSIESAVIFRRCGWKGLN